MIMRGAGNTNAAGFGKGFESCGDIHAVAVDVVAVNDYVTDVDPDAKQDAPVFGHIGAMFGDSALYVERTFDRVDDAGELDERAIAHQFDDAASKFSNGWVHQVRPQSFERSQSPSLILAHEAAVSNYICGQYGSQSAPDTFFDH